jgi:PAS domain S-box-containing protein
MIPAHSPGTLEECHQLLDAIGHVQSLVTSSRDPQFVLNEALSALLALTGSEHGFLGEVRTGDLGQRYIGLSSVQTRSSDPRVLNFFEQYDQREIGFYKSNSLIGQVLHYQEPLVTNAPSSDPRGGGLPEGHPPLASFAGLPLRTKNGMVGMVGLANRPGGYDEERLSCLQPLLDCCSGFIDLHHSQEHEHVLAETFQRSFQNTHDGLAITNVEGTIIDWNPQAEKLTGYTKNEVVGRGLPELGLKWDATAVAEMFSAAREKGYGQADLTLYNRNGDEVFADTSIFPVAHENGGPASYMWVMHDITRRRNLERDLQDANDRFEAFAQNSRTAFWTSSLDGKENFYMSPAVEAIVGFQIPRLEIRAGSWTKLVHPDDYEGWLAARSQVTAGASVTLKYRIILPDGSIRWILSHTFLVKGSRADIRRAGLLEDVTENEENVARMHAAVADKEALLKEMYHRVKNNLQIISSLMRLQERNATGVNTSSVLQESRQRVETIALLHEHLYQSESFSSIQFQTYAKRLVANLIGLRRDIQLIMDVEPLPLDFQTAVLCGLILNELLTNCLRHAFPDGENGKITVRSRTEDKKVWMEVSDDGAGLPPGFELGKTKTLGLTLVQRLTSQLKGAMSMSSHNGTTVRIEFPAEKDK